MSSAPTCEKCGCRAEWFVDQAGHVLDHTTYCKKHIPSYVRVDRLYTEEREDREQDG